MSQERQDNMEKIETLLNTVKHLEKEIKVMNQENNNQKNEIAQISKERQDNMEADTPKNVTSILTTCKKAKDKIKALINETRLSRENNQKLKMDIVKKDAKISNLIESLPYKEITSILIANYGNTNKDIRKLCENKRYRENLVKRKRELSRNLEKTIDQ